MLFGVTGKISIIYHIWQRENTFAPALLSITVPFDGLFSWFKPFWTKHKYLYLLLVA
jgi:hypothetical protein